MYRHSNLKFIDSIRSEFHLSKALNSKLREVVDKIVTEINRVRQGKYDVSYSDIVNYILGHGDLAFNFQD